MGELQRDSIDRSMEGKMENRQAYLMEKFGGTEGYGNFIAQLRESAQYKKYSIHAIDKAINELTKKLNTVDLSRVKDIRGYSTTIFYRELGEASKKEPTFTGLNNEGGHTIKVKGAKEVIPEEGIMSHVLSVLVDDYTDWDEVDRQERANIEATTKQYKETKALVDNLDGKLRGRTEKYLRGYSEDEIATQEGKSRQAISDMIAPQLEKWHWNKEQVKQIRDAWLFTAIQDIAKIVEPERVKCLKGIGEISGYDQIKLKAYHKYLYQVITTDPRTQKFSAKYTIDDMPELDNTLFNIARGENLTLF